MKTCALCGETKALSEFNKKGDGSQPYCRICQKIKYGQYYRAGDKARVMRNNIVYREAMQNFVNELKNVPCMDCKGRFPHYVMDFDHRDPSIKEFQISKKLHKSRKALLTEIAKCDIVCSNCHIIRTHGGAR